ncbi:putative hydro-lyase [Undibacterium arcticum]|uniref:Putative hydro-lyase ACFOFO_22940 n=1 Tax=Undibacterium arcticum TaxID=1762892 RepID=A0ABV7F9P0_9BURK
MTPFEFRSKVRNGQFREPTAGHCGDFAQANLVIVAKAYADDFFRFCFLNPKSCPVLAVGEPGQWDMAAIGTDIDIRTDVPGYYVYRDGRMVEERTSLQEIWQPDFVVFAIGCSFSFKQMLIQAGIRLRHIEQQKNVAMYRTNIKNKTAGPFGGDMVVSMRPMTAAYAIKAIQITSRFPAIHGAPVHIGNPAEIGIGDIDRPDFGDAVSILPNELPVFWACGVTPQEAIRTACLPIAITHKPGYMLVTDIPNSTLAVF